MNRSDAGEEPLPGSALYPFPSNQFDGEVTAMAVDEPYVYVGGRFERAGGVWTGPVAQWDGRRWSPLGQGIEGRVNSMATFDGDLYVGGDIRQAGGEPAMNIARWNGTSWSSSGTGFDNSISVLTANENYLYAGGWFTQVEGRQISYVARWDGEEWSSVGDALTQGISSMAIAADGILYVAGGGNLGTEDRPLQGIAAWDGGQWNVVGGGVNGFVESIAVQGSEVYVGGRDITQAGDTSVADIAQWNGKSWDSMNGGIQADFSPSVKALLVWNGKPVAGGKFNRIGKVAANHLAMWEESAWSPMGDGASLNPEGAAAAINALGSDTEHLYAAGAFLAMDDNRSIKYFARRAGETWESVGPKVSPLQPLLLPGNDGRLRILMARGNERTYELQASQDLTDWTTVETIDDAERYMEVAVWELTDEGRLYFRVISPLR